MHKSIYNSKSWVLAQCTGCNRLNYVEPHGITAECKCSPEWIEHQPIPMACRDFSGMVVIRKPPPIL